MSSTQAIPSYGGVSSRANFRGNFLHLFGLVGKHGTGDDITDGTDGWDVGLECRVYKDNSLLVGLDSNLLKQLDQSGMIMS